MILSQNQAEQREDVTNDFENINEIKRFVWNYKATLVIFLLNLAGFVLTEIYGNKIYNIYMPVMHIVIEIYMNIIGY